jgi:hypothetical protein
MMTCFSHLPAIPPTVCLCIPPEKSPSITCVYTDRRLLAGGSLDHDLGPRTTCSKKLVSDDPRTSLGHTVSRASANRKPANPLVFFHVRQARRLWNGTMQHYKYMLAFSSRAISPHLGVGLRGHLQTWGRGAIPRAVKRRRHSLLLVMTSA